MRSARRATTCSAWRARGSRGSRRSAGARTSAPTPTTTSGRAVLALGFGLAPRGGRDRAAVCARPRRELRPRAARPSARPVALLSSPTGLVWRLTWGAILGWAIGGLLTGMLSTALASIVDQIGGENPAVEEILSKIGGGRQPRPGDHHRSSSRCSGSSRRAAPCRSSAALARRRRTAPPSPCCPRPSAACAGSPTTSWSRFVGIVLVVAAACSGPRSGWRAGRRLVAHGRRRRHRRRTGGGGIRLPRPHGAGLRPRSAGRRSPLGWTLVLVATCSACSARCSASRTGVVRLAPFEATPDRDRRRRRPPRPLVARRRRRRSAARHPSPSCAAASWPRADSVGTDDRADLPRADAAEQAAAMLTAAGMPRMPARVMMALVGSPDEGYSAAELAERLGVSAAAVSGAVRYLQTHPHRPPALARRRPSRPLRPHRRRLAHRGDRRTRPLYGMLADFIDAIADENTERRSPSSARTRHVGVLPLPRGSDAAAPRGVGADATARSAADQASGTSVEPS